MPLIWPVRPLPLYTLAAAALLLAGVSVAQVPVQARLTPPASGWDAPAAGEYVTVRVHVGTPSDGTGLRFAGFNVFYDPAAYTLVSRALGAFATSRDYDDSDGASDGLRLFRHDADLYGDGRSAFSFSVALFDGVPLLPADGGVAFTAVLQVRAALPEARYAMMLEEVELRNGASDLLAAAPSVTYEPRTGSGTAAGWRLVSPPVSGATVATLAALNLVQGVGTAGQPGAEFAGASPNLFTGYAGNEGAASAGFTTPTSTAEALTPGKGTLWYFFGSGGPSTGDARGTSRRAPLPLTLAAHGLPLTGSVTASFTAAERAGSTNGFYLLGNPYPWPFDLSEARASAGLLSDVFQVYRAGTGWQILIRQSGDASDLDDLAPWQGVFAEVTASGGAPYGPPSGTPLAVTFAPAGASQSMPGYIGKGGLSGPGAVALLPLAIRGTLNGRALLDEAASLAFATDAVPGWDRLDASKLPALTSPALALSVGGTRTGTAVWQAQRSLPALATSDTDVPLRLDVPAAMPVVLSWGDVPAGVAVELMDARTGAVQPMRSGGSYSFEAVPGDSLRLALRVRGQRSSGLGSEAAGSSLKVSALAPNPAGRAGTRFSVRVGETQPMRVAVHDLMGREVLVLFAGLALADAPLDLHVPTETLASGHYAIQITGARTVGTRLLFVRHD